MINKEIFLHREEVMNMSKESLELRKFVASLTPDEIVYLLYTKNLLYTRNLPYTRNYSPAKVPEA